MSYFYSAQHKTGLPHTQGNSGNFQVEENLREFRFIFLTQESFDFF